MTLYGFLAKIEKILYNTPDERLNMVKKNNEFKLVMIGRGWRSVPSFQQEPPKSKIGGYQHRENKRINHQVKEINRNQQQIRFRNFGKVR